MNETHSPLKSGELLAIFILLMFLLLGCSAAPQASTMTTSVMAPVAAQHPSIANDQTPARGLYAYPITWALASALPFDDAVLNSLASLLSLVELPDPGEKQMLD